MLGNINVGGAALLTILGNGFLVDYWHKATDETLTDIVAYYKSKMQEKDATGKKANFVNIPHIRLDGLPWDEKSMVGDTITAKNANYPGGAIGRKWRVTQADTSPLGLTTCRIDMVSR